MSHHKAFFSPDHAFYIYGELRGQLIEPGQPAKGRIQMQFSLCKKKTQQITAHLNLYKAVNYFPR